MSAGDDLRALIEDAEQRAETLLAAYDAADPATRRRVALVEYRCKVRRCELLVVWQAPGVRLVRLPGYKLSATRTERTVEGARLTRTTDGYRHWVGRVMPLDEMAAFGDAVALDLNCDHFTGHETAATVIADADTASPGRPTRRVYPR